MEARNIQNGSGPSAVTLSLLLIVPLFCWFKLVEINVPEPYLDEFFHVRQAKAFVQGHWETWDPKITTPPGLYILSYLQFSLFDAIGWPPFSLHETSRFRHINLLAAVLLMDWMVYRILRLIIDVYDGKTVPVTPDSTPKLKWLSAEIGHVALNICLFPPLFFFYGLYYTDVVSAALVLYTYRLHLERSRVKLILVGLASLSFRQTNIFWVSVFLGGLEIIRILPKGRMGVIFPEKSSFSDVLVGSWQHACVYDPLISQSWFEDYLKTSISLAIAALTKLPAVLMAIMPHILLLYLFAMFVIGNGGVVLGDKENHVASIHLSQMLYIWPYFMFFSFPLLYPQILNSMFPQHVLPHFLRSGSTKHQIPRVFLRLLIGITMLTIVYFNTIVHPFTLADNRHYMFYVFRLLLRDPIIKYAAVPIYIYCAWATIISLGGLPDVQAAPQPRPISILDKMSKLQMKYPPPPVGQLPGHRVSFVLVWLIATALSLVSAPLVEPRYFIVPWVVWRLHMHSPRPQKLHPKSKTQTQANRWNLFENYNNRLWLETAWFIIINFATGYIFLYWGFEWPQEPGKVQRFMW